MLLYFCLDCNIQCCKICICNNHYQHSLKNIQLEQEKSKLLQKNIEHIKWLSLRNNQIQIISEKINLQLYEKFSIEENLKQTTSLNQLLNIKEIIEESDHQTIINNAIEEFYLENQEEIFQNNIIMLDAQKYELTIDIMNKLCEKLQNDQLKEISIKFCNSNLNSIHLNILINKLLSFSTLSKLDLQMQNTQIDNQTLQIIEQLFQCCNLYYFEANIYYCIIDVQIVMAFCFQNKQIIKGKFKEFKIYHDKFSFVHNEQFEDQIDESRQSIYLDSDNEY